ncbi:MAG TPA: NAD-dependent epimerase/dehydratase family protein [Flavobacterium sp.]|jgi:nucleoside-diphosphate-sugar epimerase
MVLITGATGLVGSHLALHLLERGEKVRATYRKPQSRDYTKATFALYGKEALYEAISWYEADINDIPALTNAFAGVTEVYHCAAFISFNRKLEEKMRKVNIEGTANLVNLAIDFKIRKICFVSSIAALGDPKERETTITEETEWNPEKHHSDYAITKYGAEMESWRATQEGIDVVIVNPGVILGPVPPNVKSTQGSGEIFTAVANELPFYTNGGTGFVTVTDVVAIMFMLMKSDISGERFTIIEGNYTFRDIINTIADALKVKRPTIHALPWMTSLSWKLDWILSVIIGRKRQIYRDMAKSLHNREQLSNDKVVAALQYRFTDIHSYIREVVELQKGRIT